MPVYVNGGRNRRGGSLSPKASSDEIVKRIIDAIRETGKVGYTGHLSEEDMNYLKAALKDIADKTVKRIFQVDVMSGVDISRVVDVRSAVSHGSVEVISALVD